MGADCTEGEPRRRPVLDAVAMALLAALAIVIYRKISRLWWTWDDPFLLNILGTRSLIATLTDRGLYEALRTPLFNPFLMFSLKADFLAFGMDARGFYLHQLIAFALLPPMHYLLLRLWCTRAQAAVAAAVMLACGPALVVVPQLMLRHYIEGAVLAMAATALFVIAVRRNRVSLAILSAIVYFVAAGAKEVYAPLVALLLVIPEGSWRGRVRMLLPHGVAGAAFAAWRLGIVGADFGPYGFVAAPGQRMTMLVTLPARLIAGLAPSKHAAEIALIAAVLACVAIVFVRVRSARIAILAAFVLVLLPILPVAAQLQTRWSFLLWLLAASAIAFAARTVPRNAGYALLGAVLLLALVAHRTAWPRAYRDALRMSDEARVFTNLRDREVLFDARTPPVTLAELAQFTGRGGVALYDERALCSTRAAFDRVFTYDDRARTVSAAGPAAIDRACARVVDRPLDVRFTFDEPGSFFWTLGPYDSGQYAFILGGGRQSYDIAARGGFRSPELPGLAVVVRYRSPDGWTTYSPEIYADMKARRPIEHHQR